MEKKHKRGVGKRVVCWLRELELELVGHSFEHQRSGAVKFFWTEWGFGCEIWGFVCVHWSAEDYGGGFGCELWGFIYVHWSGEEDGMGFWWLDLVVRLPFAGVAKRMEWGFHFRRCGCRRSYGWLLFGALVHQRVELLTYSSVRSEKGG
ncbi:hypothetical protein KY290_024688 [Solanum tuberosum]|uniref:Uncharacterized protein n=1 Tax=Solanum tuberosum TaxID=4113 RepID=A0ABQ7UTE8_SOLTU|nr:hypothetical protein KY284_023535 [Solanum tuberosum]KAH0754418.1 hypothetical protein KY290_024688 [Solanum tuberosum]